MPGSIWTTGVGVRSAVTSTGLRERDPSRFIDQFDPGAPVFLANDAEGATLGAVGPSTQGSNDVLTVQKSSGASTIVATSTSGEVIHGSTSYRIDSAAAEVARLEWAGYNLPDGHLRAYLQFPAAPTVDTTVMALQGVGGACAQVVVRTTGRVSILNGTGATPSGGDSPAFLSFPCVIGLDLAVSPGAGLTSGQAMLDVYQDTNQTPWFSTGVLFSNFMRSGQVQGFRVGVITATAFTVEIDSIVGGSGFTLAGPVAAASTTADGNAAAAATITGDAVVGKQIDGTTTGTATVTGSATRATTSDGTVAGTGTITGAATVNHPATGTTTGTGTITGATTLGKNTTGTIAGSAAITGTAAVGHPATGTSTATATITGAATVTSGLNAVGTTNVNATITGTAAVNVTTVGTQTGTATITGQAALTRTLAGTLTATAAINGTANVTSAANVDGTLTATGTLTGTVSLARSVSGALPVNATITGSLTLIPAGSFTIPRHPVVTLSGNTTSAALTGNTSAAVLTSHDWRTQLVGSSTGAALNPNTTEATLT